MRIRIKAPAGLSTSGIYGADGKEIEVGREFDVTEEPTAWIGRYDVVSGDDTEGKTVILNPAPGQPINKASNAADGENPFPGAESAPQSQMDTGTAFAPSTGAYAVDDKGGGWFAITQNGEEVTKKFRKSDLEGFEGMSDADKAAFVDLHKAG